MPGQCRGIGDNNGFPILLMNHYGKGKLFVLAIPDNFTDLYQLPEPVLNVVRGCVMADFPVQIKGSRQGQPVRIRQWYFHCGVIPR